MSESEDIINPVKKTPNKPQNRRSWLGQVFQALIAIFVGIHLYALALKIIPVPGTILMAQRAMSGDDIRRNWTRLEDISPYLVSAVIAGEDARFCQHDGIDWDAVQDAMSDNQSRNRRRGGSTITQQTAKNVFLWNGGGFVRKVPETWMASFIDYTWGKKRVMEMYLNVAEWGDGLFGAEAAARARFNTSAKELSPRQAALLASVLPSPNKWRLDPPGEYVNGRARTLQARLYVVRNEGYADCVLGEAKKRIGPAPKPKPVTKPETVEPDVELEEMPPTPVPSEIVEEVLEPAIDKDEREPAPESEEDAGVEIKPKPE
jgi:monofunctional biosynthetic peptidoglycan transglycosylase